MTLVVQRLRSQLPDGVLAFGAEQPRLSWQVSASHPGLVAARRTRSRRPNRPASSPCSPRPTSGTADAQVAVPAPGGPLRSREVRHYRVRVRDVSGWSGWSDGAADRGGPPRARRVVALVRSRSRTIRAAAVSHRRRCSGREFDVPAPIASARLHVTALGVHRVSAERSPGLRRPAGTGLDVLSPPHPGGHLRRDAPARRRGGTPSARCSATGGTAGGSVGMRRTTAAATAGSSGWSPSSRSSASTGRAWSSRTDGSWRASTAEIRAADLYDGSTIDLRVAQPGWDAPGFDDSGWIAGDQCPVRSRPDRAAVRAAGPADRRPAGPHRRGPARGAGGSTAARTSRAGSGSRFVVRATTRSSCATPRCSNRTAACTPAVAPLREGDGRVRPCRRRRGRARAGVHVPRVPLRGGRDDGRRARRAVRRDQQRHRRRARRSSARTRT